MPMGSDIRVGGVQLTQTRAAGKKAPKMDNGFGNREGDMTFSRKRETIGQLNFTINRSENKISLW